MTLLSSTPPFVDLQWIRERPQALSVALADVRWYLDGSSGRDAYESGHLPGAVFVDLDRWLSGPASRKHGRNPLPIPAVFAAGMSASGIGDGDVVVAYDDAGGVIAARLVWMLRSIGHAAAVLDGGMAAYDGALETAAPAIQPRAFTERPWPADLLAGIDETVEGGAVVMDARNRDRYEGRQDPIDPRPGHIPGAVNVPCRGNLEPDGRLAQPQQLRENFRKAGIESADGVISYCGSGVTACHNLLVMEHVGLGLGRLFVGGWSQYAHASHLPIETNRPVSWLQRRHAS
ncbi:sulfurtransferase [Arthrobacter sp. OAP107]|uniref:sulfurtransferase n=1 Tax=Arthrobacter sp. OAP107 TaxID=3156445 RepID=UPI0033922577